MALIKAFVAADGTEHAACYWKVGQVILDADTSQGAAQVNAYKDSDARQDRRQPVPGGYRLYAVQGQEFDDLYSAHTAPGGPNLYELLYSFLKNHPDGFFADAEDA